MSQRARFLFFAVLALVVLTQIVILHWGPEAIFFVTWLCLAIVVRHDSRLSASIGLAFLAVCPFLLLAKKDAVAEQAANYAYFFLGIGVLVQLEELWLERYNWSNRKLDFSSLWQPAQEAFRRRWTSAAQALGRQLAAADRSELVRLVQIAGAAALALAFLVLVLTGGRWGMALPLLGGALLFPFIVWGMHLAVRAWGSGWVLQVALALVVLPLAAAELVWLHDLITADQLARMRVTYDFIDHLGEATHPMPPQEGEAEEMRVWTIEQVTRRVLYQHPAFAGDSRISYPVRVERNARLALITQVMQLNIKIKFRGLFPLLR